MSKNITSTNSLYKRLALLAEEPSEESFYRDVRSMRAKANRQQAAKLKLVVAEQAIPVPLRSIAVPGHVLSPGAGFRVPQVVIRTPEDVNAFGRAFISEDFQWEPGALYRCPFREHHEPSVTLIEQEQRDTLVHCYHCCYCITLLEILVATPGSIVAQDIWPDKVASKIIDDAEIGRVTDALWRIVHFDNAREFFRTTSGRETPTVFGDWGTLSHPDMLHLLSRKSIPKEYDQRLYHANILRNQAGDVVAADFYSPIYEPLFRHWLRAPLEVEEPLFCVVPWGDRCDPKIDTVVFKSARDAYDAEQHALKLPVWNRPRIAMTAPPIVVVQNPPLVQVAPLSQSASGGIVARFTPENPW